MSNIETGGPAFPVECDWSGEEPHGIQTGNQQGYATGLTMRDYFAAKAMQGMLANPKQDYAPLTQRAQDAIVEGSYGMADAMLEARK